MAKLLKLRRGTTTQHSSFTGAEGEVTVDTDKETLVVHDGSTAGGHPVAAEDLANVSSSAITGRLSSGSIATAKIANGAVIGTKIADDAVGTAQIADGAVNNARLANDSVNGSKIADNSINSEHYVDGSIDNAHLANSSVNSDKLSNGAVTLSKIQDISQNYILGRSSSGSGQTQQLNASTVRSIINVENGATADQSKSDIDALNINADTVDSLHASSFLRSDSNDECQYRIQFQNNATENEDTIATATGSQGGLEIYNTGVGNDAFMAFHAGSDYAFYFGLDADTNDLSVGGWSMGANKYRVWHAGNDGSGSGLDADTLDGVQGSGYMGKTGNYWNVNNWLQFSSSHGLYYPNNYDYHVQLDGQYLLIKNNQSSNGIKINCDSGTRGFLYANNSNQIGLLDQGGNWSLRTDRSGNTCTLYDQHFNSDTNETYDLGSTSARWKSVHAKYLHFGSSSRYFSPVGGDYGTVTVNGSGANNWEGYSIDDRAVFMHNGGTETGLYNDVDNEWLFQGNHNGSSYMYYNGSARIEASSAGCSITGSLTASGNVTAYSDARLKTNVNTIDNALDIVDELRGVRFDWKESGEHSIGVIAQEVEEVLPEVVLDVTSTDSETKVKNTVKTVDYGKMVGVLINAIKELKAEVEELKGGK